MLKFKKLLAFSSMTITAAPLAAVVSCSMAPDANTGQKVSGGMFYMNGDSNGNLERRTHLSWLHDGDTFYFDEFKDSENHKNLFKGLNWQEVPNEIRLFGVDTPEIDLSEDGVNSPTVGNEHLYAVEAKLFVLNEFFGSSDQLKYLNPSITGEAVTSNLAPDTFKPFETSVDFRTSKTGEEQTYDKDIDSALTSVTAVKMDNYNRMVANVKYIPYSVGKFPDSQLLPEYVGKHYGTDATVNAQSSWEDIGISLLRHGLARVAYIDSTYTSGLNPSITHSYVDKLISTQNKAIKDHVGIWSLPKEKWFGKGNVFPKGTHAITDNPNY